MANFGISFFPSRTTAGGPQEAGTQPGPVNPVQEAIRILSLRLPRVVGGQPLAPQPLLRGGGGMPGGGGGAPDLLMILQRLLGGQGIGPGTIPAPQITPGLADPGRRFPMPPMQVPNPWQVPPNEERRRMPQDQSGWLNPASQYRHTPSPGNWMPNGGIYGMPDNPFGHEY